MKRFLASIALFASFALPVSAEPTFSKETLVILWSAKNNELGGMEVHPNMDADGCRQLKTHLTSVLLTNFGGTTRIKYAECVPICLEPGQSDGCFLYDARIAEDSPTAKAVKAYRKRFSGRPQ